MGKHGFDILRGRRDPRMFGRQGDYDSGLSPVSLALNAESFRSYLVPSREGVGDTRCPKAVH